MAMTKDEFARYQRREAALRQIAEAFHSNSFANWKHVASLVFDEMKKHLGHEFVAEHWQQIKERYGERRARRMLPEIMEIVGDDEARRIFGRFGPLKPRDRQKKVVDAALINRYLDMPEPRNKAELIRQKLEENKKLPPEMQKALGGVDPDRLDDHIRAILRDFPGEAPHLKVVK
jgi:hypothetical protein